MKLAIVSDSHHAIDELDKVFLYLRENGISHLAHAGDFMTSEVVRVFEKYPEIKVFIAKGNMDWYGDVLDEMRRLSHLEIDDVVFFELEGVKFAISHIQGMAQNSAAGKSIDVYIHGHTHRPKIEPSEKGLVINPGSLMDGAGFMIMNLPSLEVDRKFRLE